MNKLLLLPFVLFLGKICLAQNPETRNPNSTIQWVNPFIGTGGHGHTFPGATVPFGMVQISPDTRPDPGDWDGCGGYHYSDSLIYGFSHTHLSGTGVSDYCDVLMQPVLPLTGFSQKDFVSHFDKKTERAEPGFYEVFLEKPQVKVELTASERVGFHRYSFPKNTKKGAVMLDLRWRDLVLDAELDFSRVNEGIVSGHRFSKSWAADQRLFFEIRFSKKVIGTRLAPVDGKEISEREVTKLLELMVQLLRKEGVEVGKDEELRAMLRATDTEQLAKRLEQEV